ncbi:MAG: hypothetical protein AB7G88_09915 [Thermomicrobiales bacterium]
MAERTTVSGQLTNMHLPMRTIPLLDGSGPLDRSALADLAAERLAAGARWIARTQGADGRYAYHYTPRNDRFDRQTYNEVRHAGTTYSLYQCFEIGRDRSWLDAADRACQWIRESSVESPHGGLAFAFEGRSKLGGQALAIVALLERRRVLDDAGLDDLVAELTTFMAAMEQIQSPGQYFNSYMTATGRLMMAPASDYYPGEALLALTRLAQHFPDGPFLEQAVRAANFLVFERDGNIPQSGVPRHDHWLAMALSELYPLHPEPAYATVAYMQADAMIRSQIPPSHPNWLLIGASRRGNSANFTSTATKCEAMNAVWSLASYIGDDEMIAKVSEAALRTAQFLMRVQYDETVSRNFPVPEHVIGAWPQDEKDSLVRVDFVQHNISSLVGAYHLVRTGRMPVASQGSASGDDGALISVAQIETLPAGNRWSDAPVVHLVLDSRRMLGKEVVPFKYVAERLGQLVGGMADGDDAPQQPQNIGEVMGYLILGLQKLGGWDVTSAGASQQKDGIYDVFAAIEDDSAGKATAELAARALNDMLHGRTHSETFVADFERMVMKPGFGS